MKDMAINSIEVYNKVQPKSSASTYSTNSDCSRITKINKTTDGSINSINKCNKSKKDQIFRRPYITEDRIHVLSKATEKKFIHKKYTDIVSSFPLSANIYRANSDKIRPVKRNIKKNKKSLLTLPNDQIHVPEICTVSEMNDSEYYNREDEYNKTSKKKRPRHRTSRIPRRRNKKFEFYDRDAQYCSQMNINFDCRSTDIISPYHGDGSKLSKKSIESQMQNEYNPCNVWDVLRNVNKFQFRHSSPISDNNMSQKIIKKIDKGHNILKDKQGIETCRTEEFASISSFDTDNKSPIYSPRSSFDRITVIDKWNGFSKFCKEFNKSLGCDKNWGKGASKVKILGQINVKTNTILRNLKANRKDQDYKEKKYHLQPSLIDNKTNANSRKYSNNKNNCKEPTCTKTDICTDNILLYNSDQISLNIRANNLKNFPTDNNKIDKYEKCNNNFEHSGNSDSNKGSLYYDTRIMKTKKGKNKLAHVLSNESYQSQEHTKAITKIVLNECGLSKCSNSRPRNARLPTTMASPSTMPNLTQTDIKRKLNNMKFPITILNKDQLSSSPMQIENYEQFQGLDKHIWPFMIDWYSKNKVCKSDIKKPDSNNVESYPRKKTCKERIKNVKNKTQFDHSLSNKKFEYPANVVIGTKMNNNIKLEQKKIETMREFKDKMLKVLYKKPSLRSLFNSDQIGVEQGDSKTHNITKTSTEIDIGNLVDVSTEAIMKFSPNKGLIGLSTKTNKHQDMKHSWGNGKWANVFIENVIKKIKSGIYYNEEGITNRSRTNFKEASIQTTPVALKISSTSTSDEDQCPFVESIKVVDTVKNRYSIPEFDSVLPSIEIKTLNMKEIAIKHYLTNIMVQFDISLIPTESNLMSMDVEKPLSLIPLSTTNSKTRILKCKTTIFNAKLPAEVCSIVPEVMRRILSESHVMKQSPFSSILLLNDQSHLSTIPEYTVREICHISPSQPYFTKELKCLLVGRYSKPVKNTIKKFIIIDYHENNLLENVAYPVLFKPMLYHIRSEQFNKYNRKPKDTPHKTYSEEISEQRCCTILQPYEASKHSLIKNSTEWYFVAILSQFWNRPNFTFNFDQPSCLLSKCIQQNIAVNITNYENNIVFYDIMKYNNTLESIPSIHCTTSTQNIDHIKRKQKKLYWTLNQLKTNKRRFMQQHKECKSTSNISAKRSNTSLTKIGNLEDFLQALGCGKLLSSVFDGHIANRILSCINEMKNWISEISQQQAMLILLLINKKETPDLVRFRPVLLQGIAVKRITRYSDLDMEIEVIERENFKKSSEYDGISYMTGSVENHANLLEELYWIAKTTASDYQLPFDESSEKLLKSLLEKRKKLNPSYLRVMARYVGLGLLKPRNKK